MQGWSMRKGSEEAEGLGRAGEVPRLEPGPQNRCHQVLRSRWVHVSTPQVRSYERILRRLLSGVHESEEHEAHPAAVLIVNLWRCCRFNGTAYTYMKYDE